MNSTKTKTATGFKIKKQEKSFFSCFLPFLKQKFFRAQPRQKLKLKLEVRLEMFDKIKPNKIEILGSGEFDTYHRDFIIRKCTETWAVDREDLVSQLTYNYLNKINNVPTEKEIKKELNRIIRNLMAEKEIDSVKTSRKDRPRLVRKIIYPATIKQESKEFIKTLAKLSPCVEADFETKNYVEWLIYKPRRTIQYSCVYHLNGELPPKLRNRGEVYYVGYSDYISLLGLDKNKKTKEQARKRFHSEAQELAREFTEINNGDLPLLIYNIISQKFFIAEIGKLRDGYLFNHKNMFLQIKEFRALCK